MRTFSFCSNDSMDAVLFSRGIARLNTQTGSESNLNNDDDSSDLDLTDLLQIENREDQDERRDNRSETRASNSSEGSLDLAAEKQYSDRKLKVLLEAIDVHAEKLGMKRSDFLSRVESIIRTDHSYYDSSLAQCDTSDESEIASSSSSDSVYSFAGLMEEIGRIFQCTDRSSQKFEKTSSFQKALSSSTSRNRSKYKDEKKQDSVVDRPMSFCGNIRNTEQEPSNSNFKIVESETLNTATQVVERDSQKHATQLDKSYLNIAEETPYTDFTTNLSTNTIPTLNQNKDAEKVMGRSLLSLSSSSSVSTSRDNDESLPVLKTGCSFISYSTEGIVTLKTRSDFNTDSTNLMNSVSYFDNLIDHDIPPVQETTISSGKEQSCQTSEESEKRRKSLWSRLFRRSGRRRSRRVSK